MLVTFAADAVPNMDFTRYTGEFVFLFDRVTRCPELVFSFSRRDTTTVHAVLVGPVNSENRPTTTWTGRVPAFQGDMQAKTFLDDGRVLVHLLIFRAVGKASWSITVMRSENEGSVIGEPTVISSCTFMEIPEELVTSGRTLIRRTAWDLLGGLEVESS